MPPRTKIVGPKKRNVAGPAQRHEGPSSILNNKWSRALLNPNGNVRPNPANALPRTTPVQYKAPTQQPAHPLSPPTSFVREAPDLRHARLRQTRRYAQRTPTPAPRVTRRSRRSKTPAKSMTQPVLQDPGIQTMNTEEFIDLLVDDEALAGRFASTLHRPVQAGPCKEELGVKYARETPIHDLGPLLFHRQLEQLKIERTPYWEK